MDGQHLLITKVRHVKDAANKRKEMNMSIRKIALLIPLVVITCSCTLPLKGSEIHDALNYTPYFEAIEQLLKEGTDVNQQDRYGRTPLYKAALRGDLELCKLLLDYDGDLFIGASWKAYSTPLHIASEKGHVEIVRLFILEGVDVNLQNAAGDTPLHFAAKLKQIEVVKELLRHDANVNLNNNIGEIPLNGMGIEGKSPEDAYEKTVEVLIKSGADIYNRNKYGHTPLIDACSANATKVVKMLIEYGSNVNDASDSGFTCLMASAFNGNVELVTLLLDRGANPNLTNKDGNKASFYARENGYMGINDILLLQ